MKTKNARRMSARRLIAQAWKHAERREIEQGMLALETAMRLYPILPETIFAIKSALYPNDTRLAAKLANLRERKYQYSKDN